MGFQTPTKIKMQHTNQAELNQLYGTFCRVWAAGGQATFSTTSLEGIVTAKLEVKLGQPTHARPGAPLICALPKLSLLNIKTQHLELLVVLATEDPLPRLSTEPAGQGRPGQQLIKLQRLLLQ